MNYKAAAVFCAALLAGASTPAKAQYIPGSPWFSEHGMIGSIPPQRGLLDSPAYGAPAYRIRPRIGRRPPPDYCPPGQLVSRRPPVRSGPKCPNGQRFDERSGICVGAFHSTVVAAADSDRLASCPNGVETRNVWLSDHRLHRMQRCR